MVRHLSQYTILTIIFAIALWGQGPADGQKSALPAHSSASPAGPPPGTSAQPPVSTSPSPAAGTLGSANLHYRRGEFDAAIQGYNLILKQNPKSPDAYAGLVHVYLKQKVLDQAYEIATEGAKATDAPTVQVALGEVLFRQGKIPEAEQEWVKVINTGYPSARAYWGLSRVRAALSLYAQAKQMLDKAHDLDPTDSDIQKYWIGSLSRAEQIQFWENYLASPTNDDSEARADLQHHLEYLRAMEKQPHRSCHLVSHIPSTDMNLLRVLSDPVHFHGYSVEVSVNGKKGRLALDTGASGVVIDQGLAHKADIAKVSEMDAGGIGDKGRAGGFFGFADSIKIGELEFQDCRVHVIEKRSVVGNDGLIGADMFSAFLMDIDFPKEKLRLTPLPKRPDEKTTGATLPTGNAAPGATDETPAHEAATDPSAKSSSAAHHAPRDRYIAPEMRSYTQVYRFGHNLLIPTSFGDQSLRLFVLDTGSSSNLLSLRAAQANTKVRGSQTQVEGLSGSVKQVYSADKALLQFGHLRQQNQDVITFDLSKLSDNVGTEVSGILGFSTLGLLDIRIDYRDGIVDFSYKPRD